MKERASRGSAILIGASLLISTACGYGVGPAAGPAPEGAVHLNVTNLSGGPMEVYASGHGTSYRIGMVDAGLSSQFIVRQVMTVNGPVEFFARSVWGPFFRSGPILLAPGSVVDFRIAESPVLTTATVRP
jgi:hypothetical protein